MKPGSPGLVKIFVGDSLLLRFTQKDFRWRRKHRALAVSHAYQYTSLSVTHFDLILQSDR